MNKHYRFENEDTGEILDFPLDKFNFENAKIKVCEYFSEEDNNYSISYKGVVEY